MTERPAGGNRGKGRGQGWGKTERKKLRRRRRNRRGRQGMGEEGIIYETRKLLKSIGEKMDEKRKGLTRHQRSVLFNN